MHSSETACGTILPNRRLPIPAGIYSILPRVCCQSGLHALRMNFRRFGLSVSEQARRLILTSVYPAQKAAQAILVADQIPEVTRPREFLCLEPEVEHLSLP